jgi:hypothetical protein
VHRLVVLACIAGCGRFGFHADDAADAAGGEGSADAYVSTGPIGPRWIVTFSNNFTSVAGRNGEVSFASSFTGTFTVDPNVDLTGNGFVSTAFVRYDATGTLLSSTVFDADGFCDMRSVVRDGDDTYVVGFTQGTVSIPAYGACSIATNRQDPIAIKVDAQGNQTLAAHWIASGGNAQGWRAAVMPDHTLTISGIYSTSLQIGSNAMPTGLTDPSVWFARSASTVTDATWAKGFTAGVEIHGGPVSVSGDEVCVLGSHRGTATVFGSSLPYVGAYDAWIARLDGSGTEKFVRAIGSLGDEPSYGDGKIVALDDGGCIAGLYAQNDVTLETGTYPVSDGPGLLVRLAADGTVTSARRLVGQPFVTLVSGRLIAAFGLNNDIQVVELDLAGGPDIPLGVISGAGQQFPVEIAAVGPDAVAITLVANGATSFGSTSFDTGTTSKRAVAVLGI